MPIITAMWEESGLALVAKLQNPIQEMMKAKRVEV
jgi:hypothetical protein